MRRILIAGNWKMNLSVKNSIKLAKELKSKLRNVKNKDIVIFPSFLALEEVGEVIKGSNIKLGAQDINYKDKGAFTGEVSALMLKEVGCKYVIVGHSERRQLFKEKDKLVNLKLKNALKNKLKPILCVGENLEQRKSGKTKKIIIEQIKKGLDGVKNISDVIIAYEPVWAISKNNPKHKAAASEDAEQGHLIIRNYLSDKYSKKTANKIRIIYGGSMKPDNVKELIMQQDIDGGLVGGGSLKAESFSKIVKEH